MLYSDIYIMASIRLDFATNHKKTTNLTRYSLLSALHTKFTLPVYTKKNFWGPFKGETYITFL